MTTSGLRSVPAYFTVKFSVRNEISRFEYKDDVDDCFRYETNVLPDALLKATHKVVLTLMCNCVALCLFSRGDENQTFAPTYILWSCH